MKQKILTLVSTVLMLVPWTLLVLRRFDWALQAPVAEILIGSYAAFMIFSGIFTFLVYKKAKIQNALMTLCLVVNSLYAVGGLAAFGMMLLPRFL